MKLSTTEVKTIRRRWFFTQHLKEVLLFFLQNLKNARAS